MDFSAPDVLIGILLVNAAICAAYGVRSIRRRHAVTTAVNRALRDLPQSPSARCAPEDSPAPVRAEPVRAEPVRAEQPVDVALDDSEQLGRHREIEELMLASTYRLSPDRLARARVPESGSGL